MFTSMFRETHSMQRYGSTTTPVTALFALVTLLAGGVLHCYVGHLIPWASLIHRAVPIEDVLAMSWAICVPLAAVAIALADIAFYGVCLAARCSLVYR